VEKIQVSLKSDKNNGYFTLRPMYIYDNISLNSSQNKKCFQTKVVQKIKTYTLCSITVFRKSCHLWDNVQKYGTVIQATDGNIICWIIEATDTHSEYVTLIAFSTAKLVTRTQLNVT